MFEPDDARRPLGAVEDPVALLEALFAEAPIAFAVAHADGRCVVVNAAFIALFGAAPPADYDLFQDELVAAQGVLPYVERAFAGEAVVVPAFWHDPGDGRRIAIEVELTPLRHGAGAVRHVALWYKDVTPAQELADDRRVQHALFDAAPEAILIASAATGLIEHANARAAELFGYPREQLIGRRHVDLSAPRQPDGQRSVDAIADHLARLRTGEPLELAWLYQAAAGDLVPCRIRVVHIPDDTRLLCRVTVDDLRQGELLEVARQRVHQLEDQNDRIREANRLKSEFLAAMSHELRTPLNAIIGFSELIFYGRVEPGSREHQEFVGDILASSRHLLQLINDVLDLAKVEAGKLEFHPEPVNVGAVIAEVAGLLRPLSLQKRIGVQIEADRSLVVVVDPARFKQVLYNYLSNALKFTPDGGRIVVRTCPEAADSFRVEVEDTGVGIPPEQLRRLFSEFVQIDAGGERPPGTGLGLALTRKLVEAQGGSVGARSEPGHGSVFHAVLPRQPAADPGGAPATSLAT
jgi:PAS domain S-box-containing protein